MAANIDDLEKVLKDIHKTLEKSTKAQGTSGGGSAGTSPGGKTLKDHFAAAFKQGAQQGFGGQKAMSSMVGGIGNLAGRGYAVGGVAGAIGGPLIAMAGAMASLPPIIRAFADHLQGANREFARFSPSMAMVMAQSDFRDTMRKMEMGENLAGSAGSLASARGNLEDALAPVDTAFQNFQNNLGTLITGAMAEFLEQSEWAQQLADMIEDASESLESILEWLNLKKEKDDKTAWDEEMERMARGEDLKRLERSEPVRKPPGSSGDPRPNFTWDRKAPGGGGEF